MKTLRHYILSVCIGMSSTYTYGQTTPITDEVYQIFTKNIASMPQEKSYLHIDKPYYLTGDTIWLKGYVVDAVTHKEDAMSRYLYVELINRKIGYTKERKSVKMRIYFRDTSHWMRSWKKAIITCGLIQILCAMLGMNISILAIYLYIPLKYHFV